MENTKAGDKLGDTSGTHWQTMEQQQGDNGQWGNNRKTTGDNLEDKWERSGRQAAQKWETIETQLGDNTETMARKSGDNCETAGRQGPRF